MRILNPLFLFLTTFSLTYLVLTLLLSSCVTINTYKPLDKPQSTSQCLEHNSPVYCHESKGVK